MSQKLFEHRQIILNVYEPIQGLKNQDRSILASILILQLQNDFSGKYYSGEELKYLEKEGFVFLDQNKFKYECMLNNLIISFEGKIEENNGQYRLIDFKEADNTVDEKTDDKYEYPCDKNENELPVQDHEQNVSQTYEVQTQQVSADIQTSALPYEQNHREIRTPSKADELAQNVVNYYQNKKGTFHTMLRNGNTKFNKETFRIRDVSQMNLNDNNYGVYYESNRYIAKGKNGNCESFRTPLAAKLSIILALNSGNSDGRKEIAALRELDNMNEFYDALLNCMKLFYMEKGISEVDDQVFGMIDDPDVNAMIEEYKELKKLYG